MEREWNVGLIHVTWERVKESVAQMCDDEIIFHNRNIYDG